MTNSSNVADFGIWTVTAESEVGSNYVYDVMPFMFNYTVNISTLSVTPTVARTPVTGIGASNSVTNTQTITVGLDNVACTNQTVYVTYTIMDSMNVPIATGFTTTSMTAAAYTNTTAPNSPTLVVTPSTGNVTFTPTIPQYAFVGPATVYVNIYNANPEGASNGAVSYAPVQSASFTIVMETGSQPAPSNGSSSP